MPIRHNPTAVAPPFSAYSHAVEVAPGARWLHVSGQVGVQADGSVPSEPGAQIEQAWRNVLEVVKAAGMGPQELVKVTAYLTRPEDIGLFREVRDTLLDGAQPASTLIVVAGLAHPDWLVEIEAVAAAE